MTEDMYKRVAQAAGCKVNAQGDMRLPEGRTLTLHAAHDGASLSVTRLAQLGLKAGVLEAVDTKGEVFLLSLEDVFAASVTGTAADGAARKAGFIG